jgi:catechol 2,3-dioxygenase-like lactoylglutathione lyase family enzyme
MTMPGESARASFHDITPLAPAGPDLAAAIAFYTEQMGFSVVWQGDSMAGIRRDRIALNLVENDNREWAENTSFSIAVSDLEALYEEYRHIPARIGPLEMKVWGRREFYMIVPPGVAFQFYQHQDA